MRNALRQLVVWLSFTLCALSATFAQTPPKPEAKAPTLDAIIAMEDANARVVALQTFLKANPNNDKTILAREALVASYAQVGENHLNDNQADKAMDAFQRAVRALPKTVSDRFFEDVVSRIPMVIAARGYRTEAVTITKTLETRFAGEATRLAALGEFYLTIEASGEAVIALEKAAKLAPEDARLHRALGAAYRMGLRIDEAVAAYQLAVRYDPRDRRAFYDLANLYRSQGAYDDAIKLYRRQLEIEPKHTPSLKGLALALTALGKDDEAAAELNKARDLAGSLKEITDDLLLQTQLAFYYLAQNKLKQAEQAANASLAVEPRFSWARIVAAEILIAQGKYFEAERHLIEAQKLASFPTLAFTLGKIYLIVEDFDGAAEQFAKAFRYSSKKQFTTRLGGVRDMQSDDLRELLAPEHQAAIFLAEAPTSDELFRIAESLVRVNGKLAEGEPATKSATSDPLEAMAQNFVQAENSRRSFRALYMATKLAQAGRALSTAIRMADQSLDLAEVATEAEGSLRDYPNYDRAGRLHVFRGRALDARGWAQFKSGRIKDAMITLSQAVVEYGNLPEGKRALWHLATAHEAAGAPAQALELYLAAYEPPQGNSKVDIQRTVIESLYRKVNNSLDGLEAKLGQPISARTVTDITTTSLQAQTQTQAAPIEVATKNDESKATVTTEPSVETKPTASIVAPSIRRETATAATNKPAQTKSAETPAATAPQTEPVRLGLFGIPVSSKNARPTNKPAATNPPPAPKPATETTTVAQKNEPPVATPKTDATQSVSETLNVKEDIKARETAPIEPKEKELATVTAPPQAERLPASTTNDNAKEAAATKGEEKPVEEKAAANNPETKAAEVSNVTTPPATVVPELPAAPIEAPKTEPASASEAVPAAAKPETTVIEAPNPLPVQLPELTSPAFTGSLVVASVILPAAPSSLAWVELDETPAPPAPAILKPVISPKATAIEANTEPTITVRYDELPAKPAAAPTGESGHALKPTASGRPRRVMQAKESPATPAVTAPPSAAKRPRRVSPPTKP